MEKTARSLVALLRTPDPNLRLAAMRVVAALELRSKAVVDGLAANLEDDVEEVLQVQALRALAQLGPADALHLVAPKLLASGTVRQHAAQVLQLAGAASVPVLAKLWDRADFHGKRAIASTLGGIGGTAAFRFLLRAVPPEDLEMIKHLTGCLRTVLDGLPAAGRVAAAREMRGFLRDKATLRNPHAVIAGLVLLGGMQEPAAVLAAQETLLDYLDRKQPEAVRRNASVSLGRLPVTAAGAAKLLPKLVPFLSEPEWAPVAQNVLPLVQRLELPPAAVDKLLPLLRKSPHAAVQGHVLERLRGHDTPAVVKEVLPFLAAEHPRLRDAAESTLKTLPGGADALLALWLEGADPDVGRRAEAILRAQPEPVRGRCAARAAERLLALHEKGDGRWEAYLDFVRSTDAAALQKRAAARLKSLRAAAGTKKWQSLERLLQLLWDQGLGTRAQRYEYGLVLLRRSRKDVGREARAADPALRVLGGLARQDGVELAKDLGRVRGLGAEDLYYLGFHWTEAGEELRPVGQALLEHVVKSFPRHKLRRAAEHKLVLAARVAGSVAMVPPAPATARAGR